MEKVKNYLIVLLVIIILGLTAYIVYVEVFDKEIALQCVDVQNPSDIENDKEETNNKEDDKLDDNKEEADKYIFEKINLTNKAQEVKLGDKTYNLSKKDDGNSENIFNDKSKLLDLEGKLFLLREVYVWHDLLVVVGQEMNNTEIYAFDKNLKSLGLLSSDSGFYTRGQQGVENNKNPYEFNEESIIIYESNIGIGGEIISTGDNIEDLACGDVEYKNVAAEFKKSYKYENGKLTSPVTEINRSINSIICDN